MVPPPDPPLDAGLSEVVRFLAQRAPFDALASDELAEVAAQTAIEFHPRGAVILSEDGGPVTFLRIVHSGAVDIVHSGRLLDLLGVGDALGHAAMLSGLPPGFEAQAAEDTLCYRIPDTVARPLLERARRRELAVGRSDGAEPVARLIRSPTVLCQPSESIASVAERMTTAGATAAIVELGDGHLGIVTDRDLRSRVLAVGRSSETRIDAAMTTPVFSVTPDRTAGEVLYEMLERGLHHVPVVSERGRLVGVLEDADLVAARPRSWFAARRAIARARTLGALTEVAASLPELMVDLHRSRVAAQELSRVLSALVDALTVRGLELAAPGEPRPGAGVVWLAVGSQARRELTFTSRRRGVLLADHPPPDEWLAALAAALAVGGVQGPITARDGEAWRRAAFRDELALTVLADRRVLWGTPERALPALPGADRDTVLDVLAARARTTDPPTGFEAGQVLHERGERRDHLDIRAAAIAPISAIACWAAAVGGSEEGATPERLRAAAADGVLEAEVADTLAEAFELALELQMVHQLEQLAAGELPDDQLDPGALGPLTRSQLRDVFRAVNAATRERRRV